MSGVSAREAVKALFGLMRSPEDVLQWLWFSYTYGRRCNKAVARGCPLDGTEIN